MYKTSGFFFKFFYSNIIANYFCLTVIKIWIVGKSNRIYYLFRRRCAGIISPYRFWRARRYAKYYFYPNGGGGGGGAVAFRGIFLVVSQIL